MEALAKENYEDGMMKDIGFRIMKTSETYMVTLSKRTELVVDKNDGEWEFYKATSYRTSSTSRLYIRTPDFHKVYDRARGFMEWLKKEYAR